MNCPKCEAEAPDGTVECPSCGIIYERYERSLSPMPRRFTAPEPPPPVKRSPAEIFIAVIAIIFFLVWGAHWVNKRKEARELRAKQDADLLNRINAEQMEAKRKRAERMGVQPSEVDEETRRRIEAQAEAERAKRLAATYTGAFNQQPSTTDTSTTDGTTSAPPPP